MSKLQGRLIILAFVLVPVIWVLLWRSGDHHMEKLPIMGDQEMDGSVTPWTIPDFQFVDQNGYSVSLKDYEDQVMVANFFYATCPKICPRMQNNLHLVVDKFKENPGVAFLSHTVNPAHDSVEVLKKYADKYGYPADKWHFVTGNKREIYRMAESHYKAVATETDGTADFIHSTTVVLVDKDRRIRGFYEAIDNPAFANELSDGIKALLKEYRDKENE